MTEKEVLAARIGHAIAALDDVETTVDYDSENKLPDAFVLVRHVLRRAQVHLVWFLGLTYRARDASPKMAEAWAKIAAFVGVTEAECEEIAGLILAPLEEQGEGRWNG